MSQLIYKLEHLSWERILSVCRYYTCCWLLSVCRIGAYILPPFMVHHESVDPQQGERGANLWLMGFCLCQECLPSSERGSEETQSRYLLLWCAHNEQTTEPGPRRARQSSSLKHSSSIRPPHCSFAVHILLSVTINAFDLYMWTYANIHPHESHV